MTRFSDDSPSKRDAHRRRFDSTLAKVDGHKNASTTPRAVALSLIASARRAGCKSFIA
jgi:hypothetical protein